MSYNISLSTSVCTGTAIKPRMSAIDYYGRFRITQASDNTVRIKQLSSDLSLKEMLHIPYKIDEYGYYTMTYRIGGLVIAVSQITQVEMIEDFKYQLVDAWEYYADENDSNLSTGAKFVKNWLLNNLTRNE